jgi:hypothetical protein
MSERDSNLCDTLGNDCAGNLCDGGWAVSQCAKRTCGEGGDAMKLRDVGVMWGG